MSIGPYVCRPSALLSFTMSRRLRSVSVTLSILAAIILVALGWHAPASCNTWVPNRLCKNTTSALDHTTSEWSLEVFATPQRMRERFKHEKFYARDFALIHGWNNVRFIIEGTLNTAKILGRIPILPAFIYTRHCHFDELVVSIIQVEPRNRPDFMPVHSMTICDQLFRRVNVADIGYDIDHTRIWDWEVPLSEMMDISRIRREYGPVLTTADYLLMQGKNISLIQPDGSWRTDTFGVPENGTLIEVPEHEWDNNDDFAANSKQFIRIDRFPVLPHPPANKTLPRSLIGHIISRLKQDDGWQRDLFSLRGDMHYHLEQAKWNGTGDEWTEAIQELSNGGAFTVVWTFELHDGESLPKDATKIQGLVILDPVYPCLEDFSRGERGNAKVLLQHGQFHAGRRAGFMYFSTRQGAEAFARIVINDVRPAPAATAFGGKLSNRLRDILGGPYYAAHLRRGDFQTMFGWTSDKTPRQQVDHVLSRFDEGRIRILQPIADEAGMDEMTAAATLVPPKDRKWFLSTDEEDPAVLEVFRAGGAITLVDLMKPEDWLDLPDAAVIDDWLGLVDQAIHAESTYFVGHRSSSFSGGVLNARVAAGLGTDRHIMDYF